MASVDHTVDLGSGRWDVRITPHGITAYAHLHYDRADGMPLLRLGAMTQPEVMDLLEACRVALERLQIASRGA